MLMLTNVVTWFLLAYLVVAAAVIVAFYIDTRKIDSHMVREMCGPELPISSINEETSADVAIFRASEIYSTTWQGALRFAHYLRRMMPSSLRMSSSNPSLPTPSSIETSSGLSLAGRVKQYTTAAWDVTTLLVIHLVRLEECMHDTRPPSDGFCGTENQPFTVAVETPLLRLPLVEAPWPDKGSIKVDGLVVRYAPSLPRALDVLSFEILPGEKVAIVGRTGSGRNTLALSLFRFVEAAAGRILVDGKDISKMTLADVRRKLLLVPQNPSIVGGTVRLMLDEFGQFTDAEIFDAIRRVHLGIHSGAFRDLDALTTVEDIDLSVGERQLLCLARAILKRSKVLVIDEATKTAEHAMIIKTIQQELADSTVLSIVRRMRNAVDYDRVMVLEAGKLVEFETPKVLLSNPASKFSELCRMAGEEVQQLIALASG